MTMLSALLTACAGERPILGIKDGQLSPCPTSPNCVSSQAGEGGHQIPPLTFKVLPHQTFARLANLLEGRSDTRILEKTDSYLRVEFHTTLFVDDGEFLLNRDRGVIEVRSASRIGYSDLGKNRRRMEEIRWTFAQGEVKP